MRGDGRRGFARVLGVVWLAGAVAACSSSTAGPPPEQKLPNGPPKTCVATTCQAQGKNCGVISDFCGGTLDCGSCASGELCGGGGANVCGAAACTPTTCRAQQKNCGVISDGCGGTLDCGSCSGEESCGGGGVANVCGQACRPATCGALSCGSFADGCGGMIDCGGCEAGMVCGAGGTPNVCASPPAPACADFALGSELPVSFEAVVPVVSQDRHAAPCGYDRATYEVLVAWTAPADGVYVFDTARSSFDTVITLRDGTCEGAALGCADDGIKFSGGASMLTAELRAGQTVIVAVDGVMAATSALQLHINQVEASEAGHCTDDGDDDADGRVDCADEDCRKSAVCDADACVEAELTATELPESFAAEEPPTLNRFSGTCGGEHSADVGVHFVAPRAGTFRFTASVAEGEPGPTLYVQESCRGHELGCTVGPAEQKTLELPLAAGQSVVVVVDSNAAASLSVEEVVPAP